MLDGVADCTMSDPEGFHPGKRSSHESHGPWTRHLRRHVESDFCFLRDACSTDTNRKCLSRRRLTRRDHDLIRILNPLNSAESLACRSRCGSQIIATRIRKADNFRRVERGSYARTGVTAIVGIRGKLMASGDDLGVIAFHDRGLNNSNGHEYIGCLGAPHAKGVARLFGNESVVVAAYQRGSWRAIHISEAATPLPDKLVYLSDIGSFGSNILADQCQSNEKLVAFGATACRKVDIYDIRSASHQCVSTVTCPRNLQSIRYGENTHSLLVVPEAGVTGSDNYHVAWHLDLRNSKTGNIVDAEYGASGKSVRTASSSWDRYTGSYNVSEFLGHDSPIIDAQIFSDGFVLTSDQFGVHKLWGLDGNDGRCTFEDSSSGLHDSDIGLLSSAHPFGFSRVSVVRESMRFYSLNIEGGVDEWYLKSPSRGQVSEPVFQFNFPHSIQTVEAFECGDCVGFGSEKGFLWTSSAVATECM